MGVTQVEKEVGFPHRGATGGQAGARGRKGGQLAPRRQRWGQLGKYSIVHVEGLGLQPAPWGQILDDSPKDLGIEPLGAPFFLSLPKRDFETCVFLRVCYAD